VAAGDKLRTFQGAVAIVTGAASGIGKALAAGLARRGAQVVLADLQQEPAEAAAEEICRLGGQASARRLDVRDFAAVNDLVRDTAEAAGRLDYLFNNAGITIGGEVRHYQIEDWYQVLDVNLRGVVNGVQAAYGIMVRQGFGHIVNTASVQALMPSPWTVGYAASKQGILGLTLSLRVEAATAGVRVSALCPGTVRTSILEGGGQFGKLLVPVAPERLRAFWEHLSPMEPDRFAERALAAVARNRAIIIEPRWWRISWWLNRLSPGLGEHLAAKHLAGIKAALEEPES
jgi:NAD(P)-dependent dehydrogenase (short-subunit alcohol dehydrogenase family)